MQPDSGYEENLVIPETVSTSAKYPRHPQIPTIRDTLTVIFLGPYLWLWCLLICIKKAHFRVWVKKQNRSKIFLLCSSQFVYVRGRWYRSCGFLAPRHPLSALHSTASACALLSLPVSFTRRLPTVCLETFAEERTVSGITSFASYYNNRYQNHRWTVRLQEKNASCALQNRKNFIKTTRVRECS